MQVTEVFYEHTTIDEPRFQPIQTVEFKVVQINEPNGRVFYNLKVVRGTFQCGFQPYGTHYKPAKGIDLTPFEMQIDDPSLYGAALIRHCVKLSDEWIAECRQRLAKAIEANENGNDA